MEPKHEILLSGVGGSIIYAMLIKNPTLQTVIGALISGVFVSYWATIPTARILEFSPDMIPAVAGMYGISGFVIATRFIEAVSSVLTLEFITGMIKRALRIGDQP